MNCYSFIDTNVLVSGLLSNNEDSATALIIDFLFQGKIIPLYSGDILNEYKEVLHRPKFKFNDEIVDYLTRAIERFGILVEPSPSGIVLPDMKDLPFYEVVLEKQEDSAYLVTGNTRHFPKKPFVVTPRELIELLKQE